MNIKKKSIIIPAFALLIGASLAGSITGTVAWYQYSTRVNAAYVGVSGGTSGNLQMRIKGYDALNPTNDGWVSRITFGDIETYLGTLAGSADNYGEKIVPITSGNMDKDDALPTNFYGNPLYGQSGASYDSWQVAKKENYVFLPLELRYVERDGTKEAGEDEKNVEKEVFLSDLLIQEDKANANVNAPKEDLSDAIRFHINSFAEADRNTPANHKNRLISKNGGTTATNGTLDLDADGNPDQAYIGGADKYGFDGTALADVIYGTGSQVAYRGFDADDQAGQAYYLADGTAASDANVYSMIVESDDTNKDLNILNSSKENGLGSKAIGSTIESETEFLNVEITIWVEGWQTFENANHEHVSIWDTADYIGSHFDVGFEFAVDTDLNA